jgi:nucleoid-associated protein YgaU
MIHKGSRYEPLVGGVRTVTTQDGRQHAVLPIRFVPPTPATFRHLVSDGDRLDLLSHRYYGDAERFWRIADANAVLDPEALLDEGGEILIPPAESV